MVHPLLTWSGFSGNFLLNVMRFFRKGNEGIFFPVGLSVPRKPLSHSASGTKGTLWEKREIVN